jgi:hypothetical protein
MRLMLFAETDNFWTASARSLPTLASARPTAQDSPSFCKCVSETGHIECQPGPSDELEDEER